MRFLPGMRFADHSLHLHVVGGIHLSVRPSEILLHLKYTNKENQFGDYDDDVPIEPTKTF